MKRGAFLLMAGFCVATSCGKDEKLAGYDYESSCDDKLDDDEDGFVDCDDSDCELEGACPLPGGNGGSEAGGAGGAPSATDAGAAGAPVSVEGGASPSAGGAAGESSAGASVESGGAGPGPSGAGSCEAPVAGVISADYQLLPPFADSADFTSGSCQAATTGVDVAFEVTGTANGILQATAYSTDSDVDISVRSSCADAQTELDCSSYNTSGMADVVTTPITVGQQVIVIVSRANAAAQAPVYLQLIINN